MIKNIVGWAINIPPPLASGWCLEPSVLLTCLVVLVVYVFDDLLFD